MVQLTAEFEHAASGGAPKRGFVLLASLASLLVSGLALGSVRSDRESPRVHSTPVMSVEMGHADRQRALTASAPWRNFTVRHGAWKPMWNEWTGTPHRAIGPPFALPGFAGDAASVDRAVRRFIGENPDLFGGRGVQLEALPVQNVEGRWIARYRQLAGGVPILYSDWEFRLSADGRLYLFGADAYSVPPDFVASTGVVASVAREAAKAGLAFDPSTDRVEGGRELYVIPIRGADARPELKLVYSATVSIRKPRDSQVAYVDARNGELVWRKSIRSNLITGTVTGNVHLSTPYAGLTNMPFRNQTVKATSGVTNSAITNVSGQYSVVGPGGTTNTVSASLSGPYCTVVRTGGSNAGFSVCCIPPTAVVNIDWTTVSQESERDAFFHVNAAHDTVKAIDPLYNVSDYSLTTNVDINDGDDCSAFWDPVTNSLNFYPAGSGCPNTGTMPDVIWHEYIHSVMWNMYFTLGQRPNGLENEALAEGLADAFSALMDDDPVIGNDFFGPGTQLRSIATPARWPEDANPQPHNMALIVSGALWDLRLATSCALTNRLRHFALKIGFPDDPDAGVAFSEFFLDMLDADDNDNDLSNGTPHVNEIVTAFNNHGIGTAYFINSTYTPLTDQVSNGPYSVSAQILDTSPIGMFTSATLYYSANNSGYLSLPMNPTGNPDEYSAEISAQSYGIVRYYMVFRDSYGGVKTLPGGAPTASSFLFIAGPANPMINLDMETNPNWTVGFAGDSATSGIWVRGVPVGTGIQPDQDHSANGTQCWVTGNSNVPGDPPGQDDVDGGKTTLVTNTFNATGGLIHPVLSYWFVFSNNVGDNPSEDPWRVYLSNNNGTTWTPIVATLQSFNTWTRAAFLIEKIMTPTTTMKMRFVAQDSSNLSLVEAAIDDFQLVGYSPALDVPAPLAPEMSLAEAWPNPFGKGTRVRFSLPERGPVELSVFDLLGRKLRTLVSGEQAAGPHDAEWDGLDGSGHAVSSGPYFLRLTRGDRVLSRAVVRIR